MFSDNLALFGTVGCGSHQQVLPGTLPGGIEPLIFADFKNGVYTIDGEAAALADVIEENLDWGEWSTARLQAGVGITDPGNVGNARPCLKSTLADFLTAGCTVIPTVVIGANVLGVVRVSLLDLPDYSFEFDATVGANDFVDLYDGSGGDHHTIALETSNVKVAYNISPSRLVASVNGAAQQGWDATPNASVPFNTSAMIITLDMVLESVGWYPLQDEADLPGLSTP